MNNAPHGTPYAPRRARRRPKFVFDPLPLPAHHHPGPCACVPTIGYIRVSSTTGRDRIVSPEIQLEAIVLDAHLKNRRIIKLVFDINKSGKTLEGRALAEVLNDLAAGSYRHISLWKWSRWGRNLRESLQMIDVVDRAGGLVHSATEAFDTTTPTGEFVRNLMLNIAEWQGKVIGENWKGAHGQRRTNGLPHTGRDRFGYRYVNRQYVPDPTEARLVRDAYERFIAGVSLHQLTREWNARGFTTTMGGDWTPQAVGKMLDTGFAAGYIRERSKPGDKPANRLGSYDVWRRGAQEPIIDEETWQRYRAKREARAELPVRLRSAAHALSGLVFCGICGRRMNTKYMGTKRRHNWVCSHRSAYHPDVSIGVSNEIAFGAVREWVEQRARAQERADSVTDRARELAAAEPQGKTDAEQCLGRLARIAAAKDRLRGLYLDGDDPDLTEARYKSLRADYQAEEQQVRAELARLRAAEKKVNPDAMLPAFVSLDSGWKEFTPNEHRDMLQAVIGMVRVMPLTSGRLSESAQRVEVVPAWEMPVWGDDWLAERRRWQASR